jgi:hypothetical protein
VLGRTASESRASDSPGAGDATTPAAESWQCVRDRFEGVEFALQSANDFPLVQEASKPALNLTLGPDVDQVSFAEFVSEGWRRQKTKHLR